MSKPKAGDKVTWNTQHGQTEGKVKKEVTKDVKVQGRSIKADKDNPKIVVESTKTGKQAAHKPDALHKKR